MRANETVRFVDEATFQESSPPADRTKPLEWRRSFNLLNFSLGDIRFEYTSLVNELDYFATRRKAPDAEDFQITPSEHRRQLCLSALVSAEATRDKVFLTSETQKGSGVYELISASGGIRIVVLEATPIEEQAPFRAGAFHGVAFHANSAPGEDYICIQVGIPAEELNEIFRQWQSNPSIRLSASIALQSFSFEVDDALREWYHPRELFIHGRAASAALLKLRSAWAESGSGVPEVPSDERSVSPPPVSFDAQHHSRPDASPHLRGIKHALWFIAAVAFLLLFK